MLQDCRTLKRESVWNENAVSNGSRLPPAVKTLRAQMHSRYRSIKVVISMPQESLIQLLYLRDEAAWETFRCQTQRTLADGRHLEQSHWVASLLQVAFS